MKAEELWTKFCEKKGIDINTPYDAWAFCGGGPVGDELADLVIKGTKFGTASSYDEYVFQNALDELPKVGSYSVILKDNGDAVCVIRDYEVYIKPFNEVSPFHAYAEGEGDRSLKYWRDVHTIFFHDYCSEGNVPFSDTSLVVCEKFAVEYEASGKDGDELFFVEPSLTYKDEILDYKKEMLEANSSFDGCVSLKRMENLEDYVDLCFSWSNPSKDVSVYGSKGNVVMAVRKSDNKVIGFFQAHNIPDESMERYTGHVGYSVRPSERKKGYATKLLAKAKDFLSTFGLTEIVVSCEEDNEASRKTILANGGEYLETVLFPKDNVRLERYKICL